MTRANKRKKGGAPSERRRRAAAAALRYDPERDAVPVVVASGRGVLADRIRELAREAGVPVTQDTPLADLLADLDPGTEIPEEAFLAVARIIARFAIYSVFRFWVRERETKQTVGDAASRTPGSVPAGRAVTRTTGGK